MKHYLQTPVPDTDATIDIGPIALVDDAHPDWGQSRYDFISKMGFVAAIALVFVCASPSVFADGFAPGDPAGKPEGTEQPAKKKLARQVAKRDPLAVDPAVAVKDEPLKSVDLPGVMKLEGASRDVLDPTRVRRISWANAGSQTVYVSATQPNRIQLPFVNPKVIATDDVDIDKRATGNNIYVTFKNAAPVAVQVWIEPQTESSASVGLQLVPKSIPAQSIIVVDDTVEGSAGRAKHTSPETEYLTRVQAVLEEAALGASPAGYAVVDLQVPPMSVDGLVVEGLRRLSGRGDDIYVYTATNPGATDVELRENEFDGPDVRAVSILPRPLLHPGERAVVTVLARKREGG
jgi:conjugal transfer pilus assembly protein TraK